jgi:DNA-binding MarR family transcriptional regulator
VSNKGAEVAKLFHDVSKKMKHGMRRSFEDIGITMPQGMVICVLFKLGEIKISEISKHLGLSNSTVSGVVDRLEKQQFVERTRSKTDKRIVYVKLTERFIEMHKNFHTIADQHIKKILDKASDDEIEKIIEGLKVLKRILCEEIE